MPRLSTKEMQRIMREQQGEPAADSSRAEYDALFPSRGEAFLGGAKRGALQTSHGLEQLFQQFQHTGIPEEFPKVRRSILDLSPRMSISPETVYTGERSEFETSEDLRQRAAQREQEYQALSEAHPFTASAGSFAGGMAATAPVGGIGGGGGRIIATQGIPLLKKLLPMAQRGAAQGAVSAGVQYVPEGQSRLENTLMGATLGAIFDPALGSATTAIQNTPNISRLLGPGYGPEELAARQAAAAGTNAPLGGIIGNPLLDKFESGMLANVPFGGMSGAIGRTAENLKREGTGLFEGMTGGRMAPEGNYTENIERQIQSHVENLRGIDNINYRAVRDLADQYGVVPKTNNFIEKAKEIVKKESGGFESAEAADKTFLNQLKNDIDKFENQSLRTYGKYHDNRSGFLANARKEREGLKPNKHQASLYDQLAKATLEDMETAALSSNAPELISAYDKARTFHATNVAPLRNDKKLAKYIYDDKLDKSDKIVSDFVKPGATVDQVKDMRKLTNVLDNQGMDELRYEFFKGTLDKDLGIVDPKKFRTAWNKLGPRQKQEMFKDRPDMVGQIDQYIKQANVNPQALDRMLNPQTGARNVPIKTLLGIGAAGMMAGGPAGIPIAFGLAGGAGQLATKLSTSEPIRNLLMKRMIDPYVPQNQLATQAQPKLTPAIAAGMAEQEKPKSESSKRRLSTEDMQRIMKQRGNQ